MTTPEGRAEPHLSEADIIAADIVDAIEEASHWRHDSAAWKEDENGAWAEFIQPMLDRVRARVAEVERERDDEIARVLRVTERLGTAMGKLETAERRLADLTPLARLGAWALECIRGVSAGDVDAFDVQDKATEFGVIAPVTAPKPCGECCVCEEMDADTCYRDTEATTRARAALAAAGDARSTDESDSALLDWYERNTHRVSLAVNPGVANSGWYAIYPDFSVHSCASFRDAIRKARAAAGDDTTTTEG